MRLLKQFFDFGFYEFFCVLEWAWDVGTGGHFVSTAAELLRDLADIDGPPAAE